MREPIINPILTPERLAGTAQETIKHSYIMYLDCIAYNVHSVDTDNATSYP